MSDGKMSALVYVPQKWLKKRDGAYDYMRSLLYNHKLMDLKYMHGCDPTDDTGVYRMTHWHRDEHTQSQYENMLRDQGFLLIKDLPNVQVHWHKLSSLDAREVKHVLKYCGITEVDCRGSENKQQITGVILHPNELRRLQELPESWKIKKWIELSVWEPPT